MSFPSGTTRSCCVLVCKNTGTCTLYIMPKAPECENVRACACVRTCVRACVRVFKFFSQITPGQLKPNFTWNHHMIREENLFKWFRSNVFFILKLSASGGGGALSGNFITNLA